MHWKRVGFISVVVATLLIEQGTVTAQQAPTAAADKMSVATRPIDLPTALRLAGVDNPEIRLASERVLEAVALKQLAAAQLLPNINSGMDVNHHQGVYQQLTGNILTVNRDSLYVGLGAGAVGSGTVTVPGIYWNANLANVYYDIGVSRQVVQQRGFASEAVRNDVLLQVATAYLELLRAYGRRAVAVQIRDDAAEVARVTQNFANAGQGRQSDADRAATEREQRQSDLVQADNDVLVASARLCQLLSLDPSVTLRPVESQITPNSLVPELIPLPELLVIALTKRPELKERQAAIRAALLDLRRAKVLPFSPQLAFGGSVGEFGGGSNLVTPRYGDFASREDVDGIMYWTLRNLGVGNVALIRVAQSQVRQSQLTETIVLDRVRAEVATARARVQARWDQIGIYEKSIKSSGSAYAQDRELTRNTAKGRPLPIELLDSLRLLARSRFGYLDAIVDYNRAHFELYVALGQPPADTLARPVPDQTAAPMQKK